MRIVRIEIDNFRSIEKAVVRPKKHNVYLGPTNIGKTALLEALNILLNPEFGGRGTEVDENDFFRRKYLTAAPSGVVQPQSTPSAPSPLATPAPSASAAALPIASDVA